MSIEKKKEEKRRKITEYVEDLQEMAKTCFALGEECKNCSGCPQLTECIHGIRNAVGDLAETVAWIIQNMSILDDTICDMAKINNPEEQKKEKKKLPPNKNKESLPPTSMYL